MGRPPIALGQIADRLTPKQREMLTQTIFAGCCVNFSPSTYAAAWPVRAGLGGGIELEFCQSAGDELLIAVGTPITGRPPHRTVRAEFPHKMWCTTFYA